MLSDGLALILLARHRSHYHFKSPLAYVLMFAAALIIGVSSSVLKKTGDPKDKNLLPRTIFAGIGIVLMFLAVICEIIYVN